MEPSGNSNSAVFQLSIPGGTHRDMRWKDSQLPLLQAALEQQLQCAPATTEFSLPASDCTVAARLLSGRYVRGAGVKLVFAESTQPPIARRSCSSGPELSFILLPDPRIEALGRALVGLDNLRDDILSTMLLQAESGSAVSTPLGPRLWLYLQSLHRAFLLSGDPGVGKSVLLRFCADLLCRQLGIKGTLIELKTDVRGTGHVGEFSSLLWEHFTALEHLPPDEFGALLIDEADALAVPRSEATAHSEERAAVGTLLQGLDRVAGHPLRAVFMTTNRLVGIDAALQRRTLIHTVERPGSAARRALLTQWWPALTGTSLSRAVAASSGMTPADIDRAVGCAWREAVRKEAEFTVALLLRHLRTGMRTGGV